MKKKFIMILSALTLSSLLLGCSPASNASEASTSEIASQVAAEDPDGGGSNTGSSSSGSGGNSGGGVMSLMAMIGQRMRLIQDTVFQ